MHASSMHAHVSFQKLNMHDDMYRLYCQFCSTILIQNAAHSYVRGAGDAMQTSSIRYSPVLVAPSQACQSLQTKPSAIRETHTPAPAHTHTHKKNGLVALPGTKRKQVCDHLHFIWDADFALPIVYA